MRVGGAGVTRSLLFRLLAPALCLGLLADPASAQSLSQSLKIHGSSATTWPGPPEDVICLQGPVRIEMDRALLAGDGAVIWLARSAEHAAGAIDVQIALVGNARVEQEGIRRSGDELLVRAIVQGAIELTADQRIVQDPRGSDLHQRGSALRMRAGDADQASPMRAGAPAPGTLAPTRPATRPAVQRPAEAPVRIRGDITTMRGPDGRLAVVFENDVLLAQQGPDGEQLQLQADRGVAFTTLPMLDSEQGLPGLDRITSIEQAITAVYLEGDVRISLVPASSGRRLVSTSAEQRLEAQRVFYDFLTDRAVLTQAVLRATDPGTQIPLVVRAQTLWQLGRGPAGNEYLGDRATLSTSSFAVPSYAVAADRVYVRQEDVGEAGERQRTVFSSRNATFEAFGVPVLWLPAAGGSLTQRGLPLRRIEIGDSTGFGFGVQTDWGLFESFGQLPPEHLDVSAAVDYFSDRGAALGLDGDYDGGLITTTTKQPWNFTGEFTGYVVPDDEGVDRLGENRARIDPEEQLRGRALWQHQHYLPDHWQVQLQAAWVSDATFMEEWFEREFDTEGPQQTSAYIKRSDGPEAMTFLATIQPNDLVTTADLLQEQFEVERMPEIGYHRVGDSLAADNLTSFSNNTGSGLRFQPSEASLLDQGFRSASGGPGLPSLGTVPPVDPLLVPPSIEDDVVWRADLREQVDYPLNLGRINAVPYLLGRFTAYTDSPDGTNEERVLGGAGLQVSTSFFQTYPQVHSRVLDLDRMRHVIEPEVHLFASASSADRGELFIYDEPVDGITDLSVASIGIRQRWQTYRGGPGRRRSVDVVALNLFFNAFGNEPPDDQREPVEFRGLFFPSLPEASVARDSFNADALWRISDTTVVLADAQQNLEEMVLATASIGFAAQRGQRLSYYLGARYIEELDETLASVAVAYELSARYSLTFSQSYDFDEDGTVGTSAGIRRRFDRFAAVLSAYYDDREDESGVRFSLYPEGLGVGIGSDTFSGVFGR